MDSKWNWGQIIGHNQTKLELQPLLKQINHHQDQDQDQDFDQDSKKKIPQMKGVLLMGPAGIGKVSLAKAICGETKCPYILLSCKSQDQGEWLPWAFQTVKEKQIDSSFSYCFLILEHIEKLTHQGLTLLFQHMQNVDLYPNFKVIVVATSTPQSMHTFYHHSPSTFLSCFSLRLTMEMPTLEDRVTMLTQWMGHPLSIEKDSLGELTCDFQGMEIKELLEKIKELEMLTSKWDFKRALLDQYDEWDQEETSIKTHNHTHDMIAFSRAGCVIQHFLFHTDQSVSPSLSSDGLLMIHLQGSPNENGFLFIKSHSEYPQTFLEYQNQVASYLMESEVEKKFSSNYHARDKSKRHLRKLLSEMLYAGMLDSSIMDGSTYDGDTRPTQLKESFLKSTLQQVQEILESHQEEIQKVAHALLEKKILSRYEILELMGKQ